MAQADDHWPKIVPILFDVHRPFHDARAWGIMLQVLEWLGPRLSAIAIGGDFADAYNISQYPKSPMVGKLFQDEVHSVDQGIRQLEYFKVPIGYYAGNHEHRLERKFPELCGVLSWDRLLTLSERGIKWIDFDAHQGHKLYNSNLWIKHVPETEGKYPATFTAERTGLSFVTGHVHRFQIYYVKFFDRLVKCYSSGFLGDIRSGVFDYVKGFHKWHLGFLIATIEKDGSFTVDPVSIENNQTIFWGKTFRG